MIEIRLPKCRLFLTEEEVESLLKDDPEYGRRLFGEARPSCARGNVTRDSERKVRGMDRLLDVLLVVAVGWIGACLWLLWRGVRTR